MRGGRVDGEEEGRGGLGLHECPTCRQDLGDTRALYAHLQTGGGRCLQAMGATFQEFKQQFRQRQMRSNARQKVSHGWGQLDYSHCHQLVVI